MKKTKLLVISLATLTLLGCKNIKETNTAPPPANAQPEASENTLPSRFTFNGYTIDLPTGWYVADEKHGSNEGRAIYDINKQKVADWDCPIPETGWEAWDFEQRDRQYTKKNDPYGADIWLGTPSESAAPGTPYVTLIFMHHNKFDNWSNTPEDYQASCIIQSDYDKYDGSLDDQFKAIYGSVY